MRNLPYIPSHDGFVFSTREINAHKERFHKVQLAKESNVTCRQQRSGHWDLLVLPKKAA